MALSLREVAFGKRWLVFDADNPIPIGSITKRGHQDYLPRCGGTDAPRPSLDAALEHVQEMQDRRLRQFQDPGS